MRMIWRHSQGITEGSGTYLVKTRKKNLVRKSAAEFGGKTVRLRRENSFKSEKSFLLELSLKRIFGSPRQSDGSFWI